MKTIVKLCIILSLIISHSCKEKETECLTPEDVNYTNTIAPLVEAKCFMCHAPDTYKTKASRVKIYDYASLKKVGESGQLIGSITHAKGYIAMPFRKSEKIDSCSIVLFQKWVSSGMKK